VSNGNNAGDIDKLPICIFLYFLYGSYKNLPYPCPVWAGNHPRLERQAEKRLFMMKKVFFVLAILVAGKVFAQEGTGFSVGARFGGAIPSYEAGEDLKNVASGVSVDLEGSFGFIFALQAAYNFTPMIGIQLEGIYNSDNIDLEVAGVKVGTLEASSLLIPVLLRVGTTVGPEIQIGGLAGPYFTIPLGDGKLAITGMGSLEGEWTGSMGLMLGGFVGKKMGPGTVFADLRYGFDFSDTKFDYAGTEMKALKKSSFQLSAGYSFAF
jgi:hypothetical protein